MNTKVSIVVPVYNSHSTLPKCLDSLIAQTYQDLEIICVNDNSKDNSAEIIKEYQVRDSRVILVNHKDNKNAGGARNSGIKAASGTYVCFVDNDDWLVPDAIKILVDASDQGYFDFVASQWCKYYSDTRKYNMQNLIVGGSKDENCEYALIHGCRILGCLIRREIFFKNDLFYPERTFFEDNAIAISLLYSANDIKVVNQVLYYYLIVESSSSNSISIIKIQDRIKTSDMALTNLKRLGFVSEHNQEKVKYMYLCYSYSTIKMLASIGSSQAKSLLSTVVSKIDALMPNTYLSKYHWCYGYAFRYPYFFYQIWRIGYFFKRIRL